MNTANTVSALDLTSESDQARSKSARTCCGAYGKSTSVICGDGVDVTDDAIMTNIVKHPWSFNATAHIWYQPKRRTMTMRLVVHSTTSDTMWEPNPVKKMRRVVGVSVLSPGPAPFQGLVLSDRNGLRKNGLWTIATITLILTSSLLAVGSEDPLHFASRVRSLTFTDTYDACVTSLLSSARDVSIPNGSLV